MKKLILPLLLLVAFGMLAAVESDPSNIVGYVKYPLVVGKNTIALPMVQTYAQASEVGNAIPGCNTVSRFNGPTQAWVAAAKTPFGTWTGNYAVSIGMPLLINTTTAGNFYSIGNLPDDLRFPPYTLVVGKNFIMVPLNKSALNTAALLGNDIPGCNTVSRFNGPTQARVAAAKTPFGTWTGSFPTTIGMPLLINTTIAGTWPNPYPKLSK